MMTLDHALCAARLKELYALGRLRRTIAANPNVDADWAYCLAAMDEQMHRLRDLLAREDPEVLRTAEAHLDDIGQADALASSLASEVAMSPGHRVH